MHPAKVHFHAAVRSSAAAGFNVQNQVICAGRAMQAERTARRADSALCAECLVVALGGCSLSVAANVHAKGCRPLVIAFDIFMKPSLSHRGVRTGEGVDV